MATPKTIQPPTKPDTPAPMKMRAFYCDDPSWDAAMAKAQREGIALAEVLRHYVREYGKE